MKNLCYLAVAACLLSSCSKKEPVVEAAPTPPPVVKHLAPDGTYFNLQRISVTTDDGIHGLAPGSRLTLIKDQGDTLKLKGGDYEFEIPPFQLTNDLDIAAQVAKSGATAQAKSAAILAKQSQEYNQHKQAELIAAAQQSQKADQPVAPMGSSALNQPAQRVNPSRGYMQPATYYYDSNGVRVRRASY